MIVGAGSATHEVFRSVVLGSTGYAGCETVEPDRRMPEAVAETDGAIGQISFSFLDATPGVRTISVDGQNPSTANFDYPIARPLYLLWREENKQVRNFVSWAQSEPGQRVVRRRFVGFRVIGSVRSRPEGPAKGSLIVFTETYSVLDGGIYYYPHLPYEILTREGRRVRRVPNHRGENDEKPMTIHLLPDTYLIRAESLTGESVEVFVTIEAGRVTRIDIRELLGNPRR